MIWRQRWSDVHFLHFPVPADRIRPLVPPQVTIDTHDGRAWVTYVFFRLQLRPAWLPSVPGFSSLLELNVRTYVRHGDAPGIYFLRMYADNRLAIFASRLLTPLCYQAAHMELEKRPDGLCRIVCQPHNPTGLLRVDFGVDPSVLSTMAVDSLGAWLLERYRLYVGRRDGSLLAASVEHPPWQAARVEARRIDHQSASVTGLLLDPSPALMHYSPGVTALFNAFASTGCN